MPRDLWDPQPLTASKARDAWDALWSKPKKQNEVPHVVPRASAYQHIAAWGKLRGHNTQYIHSVQVAAFGENAPADAIYQISPGEWKLAAELDNETRHALEVQIGLILAAKKLERKRQVVLV